ncbi:MAG: TIGR00730 family Rossman fold protein [Alphaproteobacteria bacterium]|nr:TIGR00730 family Rossman fold protein [Alphaproteobacteria bacterium]MBO4644470.1 TIGR00730 family Rossman fold protein [Alphaproteobacteria bacterium]
MFRIKSLGVFCGSADGKNPDYVKDAEKLGRILAQNNIRLVYGAGHVGMMGAVAKGALEAGGHVTGIINTFLQEREDQLFKLTELKIFPSLHTRKDAMLEASEAFCVLPGGIGTLDEVFEVMTLKQLEEHHKPIIMYNANGFWEPFKKTIDALIGEGYVRPEHARLITYVDKIEDILPTIDKEIEAYERKA